MQRTWTAFLMLFSQPNPKEWGWVFPFASQSLNLAEVGSGPPRKLPTDGVLRSIAGGGNFGGGMKTQEDDGRPIVFVIDDDASLRDALERLFRLVGLRAETFATAADFLKRELPDVSSC